VRFNVWQRLYLLDARKIVVANVGPIGCIPYLRDTTPTVGTACAEFPNQLARNFNRKLRGLVDELSANLTGSRFLYADVYRVFSDIIANYKSHGNILLRGFLPSRKRSLVLCVPRSNDFFYHVVVLLWQGSRWRTRRAAT
jgi:hypothetical protein